MEQNSTQSFDKTTGIVAHITLIGWIIALVMNGERKGEEKSFGAFYLRQILGLIILGLGTWIVLLVLGIILIAIPVVGPIILLLLSLGFYGGLLTLWILSLIAAINGEKKMMPIVGPMLHKMLGTAFE